MCSLSTCSISALIQSQPTFAANCRQLLEKGLLPWYVIMESDINIYVPESAKNMISNENQDLPEIFTKFSSEKTKEWNDISLSEMLGKFSDLKDIDKKDK